MGSILLGLGKKNNQAELGEISFSPGPQAGTELGGCHLPRNCNVDTVLERPLCQAVAGGSHATTVNPTISPERLHTTQGTRRSSHRSPNCQNRPHGSVFLDLKIDSVEALVSCGSHRSFSQLFEA